MAGKRYIQHGDVWYEYCDNCQRWKRIYPNPNVSKTQYGDWMTMLFALILLGALLLAMQG